ncbi:unnamed protein product [Rhizoctonia solani]|uniref:Glycogen debranching enzyme n=1 Tax=Rhizoctonia solani TaxID=456999 RepID=A0A8H2WCF1_9AGAM|nr:unnamed protein product [Rhizoctonia solani]
MWITLLQFGLCWIPCVKAQSINPLVIQPAPPELPVTSNLTVTSGGYDNHFYRSNLTSATVLLTSPSSIDARAPNRMIVAHPAGNSGSLVYWSPYGNNASKLTVTLRPGSLRSAIGPNGLHGVQGTLLFSTNAEFGPMQIGSVRQVRDYVEGGGLSRTLFNYTTTQLDESVVWFSRRWLNDTTETLTNGTTISGRYGYQLRFQAENGTRFEVNSSNDSSIPPIVRVLVPDSNPGLVSWTAQVNETHISPLGVNQVFASGSANNSTLNSVRQQFAFLTYQDKWTAGSWRFLTYFGRDTLFTTRLLSSARIISSNAIEAVIGAAIERLNYTDGRVAHEEAIGDYATLVNINEGHSERGNSIFLDYKMKDTHYLILPQLLTWALYNSTIDNATINRFLDTRARLQPNHTYRALLDKNVQYIMNTSQAFAQDPGNYRNLARIEQGIPVGNWRDSNEGIGWGIYPVDISTALQPAALHAIADLAALGVLNNSLEVRAREWGDTWERESPKFFKVAVGSNDTESRLVEYIQQTNLSTALLYGNGSLNDTGSALSTNTNNLAAFGNANFYGLSLLDNGSVVQVMNSDLGFSLLYNRNISRELITATIYALEPFPRGLLTNIGQLVANPAYDSNRTRIGELTRAAYHGTVSWSWQSSLMALGVRRAIEGCQISTPNATDLLRAGLQRPEWCDDPTVTIPLLRARSNLNKSIMGSAQEIYSEVWSWTYGGDGRFNVTPLGELSVGGTETSAVQLWSFAALALGESLGN